MESVSLLIMAEKSPLNFRRKEEIINEVCHINQTLPDNSQFIGGIKVEDSGFSINCGYKKIMADAKATARMADANIVKKRY